MMMVAKSFQSLERVTEPYEVGGRMYVKVRTKTGTLRQVRAYTEKEYYKMYPAERALTPASVDMESDDAAAIRAWKKANDPYWKSQKSALGFKDGYITIFTGETYDNKSWFKEIGCTFTRSWGWSLASNKELPTELPAGIKAIRLDWDLVGTDEEILKNETAVKEAVESLIFEPSPSEYQGAVGQRLLVKVIVKKALQLDGYYGNSTMHIMEDEHGNLYTWTTSSKSWREGSEKTIRGTVKDHKVYRNSKQTVLTRCTEVNK